MNKQYESKLSVIVPCYNEEESLPLLYEALIRMSEIMPETDFEYILVDDGSSDNTLSVMRDLSQKDSRVRYLSFSRNFGKESAMYAGLEAGTGDFSCVMDADLQDSPELLKAMYTAVKKEGYDCAAVRRVSREGEPKIRSFFARRFYKLMSKLCNIEVMEGARDYRLMNRQMVDSILSLKEKSRYSKGLFSWVGYRTRWFELANTERVKGTSKWSFLDLMAYAVEAIVSFSTIPLALSSVMGILLCVFSFLVIILAIVRQLIWGGSAYGWTSMICVILFLSGIQLFCVGILGQYLSKTFTEVKNRPLYIIREKGGGSGGGQKDES